MTKLQIVSDSDQPIGGFKQIPISGSVFLLDEYSDNECELILATSLVDNCNPEELKGRVEGLVKKLRLKGKIILGGTDLTLFAKSVVNDIIDEPNAAKHVNVVSSMFNLSTIESLLNSLKLQVEYSRLNGIKYEISAIRN